MNLDRHGTFGDLLRAHRLAAGLTQEALAESAGASSRGIRALERGETHPQQETVRRLAGALRLSPDQRDTFIALAHPVPRRGRGDAVFLHTAPVTAQTGGADALAKEYRGAGVRDQTAKGRLVTHNFPATWTSFIGRAEELAALTRLLKGARLLTLTGPGGCGKTRLAIHLATDLAAQFPDGAWLVELALLTDGTRIPQAVMTALRIREESGHDQVDTLLDFVRGRHLLLLVDNCEHMLDTCALLIDRLLQGSASLHVLATSREALGIRGEVLFPVPSLTLPFLHHVSGDQHAVANMERSEAVRLFVERATAAQTSFELSQENAAAVARVCVHLDGIPLALELAAAHVNVMSIADLAQRLDDRFELLARGSRSAPPRHRTLHATIEWSYALLSNQERLLFRRLSVFAGGFTLEAVEAVCANTGQSALGHGTWTNHEPNSNSLIATPLSRDDVLDLLTHLVDKSLVNCDASTVRVKHPTPISQHARYQLLETIGNFARERLEASGETPTRRQSHAAYYLALAEHAEERLLGPMAAETLEQLDREYANLRTALSWARERTEVQLGLRLAGALARFWSTRGYLREGREWLETLFAGSTVVELPDALRAKALYALGTLAGAQGDLDPEVVWLAQSVALYREVGDVVWAARALNTLAGAAYDRGDLQGSIVLYKQCVALARAGGNLGEVARALANMGESIYHLGDLERAEALHTEALEVARQAGRKDIEAFQLGDLGNLARRQGDLLRAMALQRQALLLKRTLGDRRQIAITLEHFAAIAAADGNGERSARLLGAATALREEIGAPQPPLERAEIVQAVAAARAALGEAKWTSDVAAGRQLTQDEAIDEALTPT